MRDLRSGPSFAMPPSRRSAWITTSPAGLQRADDRMDERGQTLLLDAVRRAGGEHPMLEVRVDLRRHDHDQRVRRALEDLTHRVLGALTAQPRVHDDQLW